ncbi:hypothetical protein NQ317_001950 [Molorchus minor]|uniref:Endonuclease/exonuclease/phosphatase domain-containing protein n=1 Tax=Molorchus minor TaxID=1323400 RepID=A0ABQ9IW53_9CUCU|nr:hypothetical protein NQ317_001950 [Molorchus minor]
MNKIKILQTNLGQSRAAHDVANKVAYDRGADLVIISEPNIRLVTKQSYITDTRKEVAVQIINKDIGLVNIEKGEGFIKLVFEEWHLYCCYISPNIPMLTFQTYIDKIMKSIRDGNSEAIFAGDLNAKSALWGSPFTDNRGKYIADWAGASKSYIDVTGATAGIAKKIHGWEVLQDEVLTYHQHIYFEVGSGRRRNNFGAKKVLFDKGVFERNIANRNKELTTGSVEELMSVLKNVTEESSITVRNSGRQTPYWWNAEIETQRRTCLRLRRRLTRGNARNHPGNGELEYMREEYRNSCKNLKKLIRCSKRTHWKVLCNSLEDDIWGKGYQIAMKTLEGQGPPCNLTPNQKVDIAKQLFPETEENWESPNI